MQIEDMGYASQLAVVVMTTTDRCAMLKFDYTDKFLFKEAMAAIDRKQPFIIVVKSWKRHRILKELDALS